MRHLIIAIASLALTSSACDDKKPNPAGKTPVNLRATPPRPRVRLPDARTAARWVAASLAEMKKSRPNCAGVIRSLMRALPVVAPNVTHKTLPAYAALAKCLNKTKSFRALLAVAYRLLDSEPGGAHAWLVPRALVGLGLYRKAAAELDRLIKLRPGDPDLAIAKCLLFWSLGRWSALLGAADHAMKLLEKGKPTDKQRGRALIMRVEALYHLGRLDDVDRDLGKIGGLLAKAPKARTKLRGLVTAMRKRSAVARRTKLAVDYIVQTTVPLGAYHLFGERASAVGGSLLRLMLYNFSGEDRRLRIDVSIPGVTENTTRTMVLLKGGSEAVRIVPPLKVGFKIAHVRAVHPAQLALKIVAMDRSGERLLYDETYPIKLLPRDFLPLSRKIGTDNHRNAFEFIGAWITPNAKAIDRFLSAAKKKAPFKAFAGEQQATVPQVKALFEELHRRGVSYVMDPLLLSSVGRVQRTRLPSEVLASTNAQCLEGSILFATLLEAIGLKALIAMVPGHALVGWRATAADRVKPGTPIFIETTLFHSGDFKAAVRAASRRIKKEARSGNFKRGISVILDVAALRRRGVTPQPTD